MAISINQQSRSLSFIDKLNQQHAQQQAQLASAKRINKAADDAAGLQIAERLTGNINELEQSSFNARDQINQNNNHSSKLSIINEGLQRAHELSVQSANPLSDQSAIQHELNQITEQVNTIASDALGQENFVNNLQASDPSTTQAALETAFGSIETAAATLGASINALTSQDRSLQLTKVNTSAARSRIEDTDFAKVTAERAQDNVLLRSTILTKKDEETRKGLLINKLI
jgi:flagellin